MDDPASPQPSAGAAPSGIPRAAAGDDSGDLRDHVRLASVPGIGARLRRLLLERFGSPTAILAARPDELQGVGRISRKLAHEIGQLANDVDVDRLLESCRERGVRIIAETSPDYPRLLSRIADPPGLLFVRGGFVPCDALAVAIVGSRHATDYGLRVAGQLAGGLARAGYTVVSGLARGIDAAAHRGALAAGGRTIAVLGSGVLNVYPPEHDGLADEVVSHGALVSEQPPFAEPFAAAFPQRNRIVSGLTLGTVVVQASDRSGALITARLAGEQGREVFAVPGPIDCRMSRGCHELIRDGVALVGGVDDILAGLGPLFETATSADGTAVETPAELVLDERERAVLAAIAPAGARGSDPPLVDDVVDATGLQASQVLATIGVLEMRRLVRRLPGNRVARS
ncbi:MAG: DNA-processing protein DprA [Planctomycetes bacterium]|nr:DNA-processing protein DprA [Planctomycetota bacterium]